MTSHRMDAPAAALILCLSLGMIACARAPLLADGPVEITGLPVTVPFHHEVIPEGPTWELCFEFDQPGDSHHAAGIQAVLLSPAGERATLGRRTIDRRGESIVCQIGQLEPSSPDVHPRAYGSVELKSNSPVRLRGIRGGSRP